MPLVSALNGVWKQAMIPQDEDQRGAKNSGISGKAGVNQTGNVIWRLVYICCEKVKTLCNAGFL